MKGFSGRFFKKGHRNGVGVTFFGDRVRIVGLGRRGNAFFLCGNADVGIPPGSLLFSGEIADPQVVSEAIAEAAARSGMQYKKVVGALHGEKVIIRQFYLPDMPNDELDSAVRWEAENVFPLAAGEFQVEYVTIGRQNVDGNVRLRILAAAAPKELVWQYYDVFTRGGLNPIALEVEPVALARLLFLEHSCRPAESSALIDFGSTTYVMILSGGDLVFHKRISGVCTGTAVEESQNGGSNQGGEPSGVLGEVERSLKQYRVQNKEVGVSRIFISGAGVERSKIKDELEERLKLPAAEFSFLSGGSGERIPADYGTAVGLALREVMA